MLPWLEGQNDAANGGSINLGGPITTELSKGKLPASAPVSADDHQSPKGKQFVVISANGHNIVGDPHDEIVAFALPD